MAFSDPVSSKLLGSLFGDTLDPSSYFGDSRISDYYNKNADKLYALATEGQTFDPVSGGLKGGRDLRDVTLEAMRADPSTASLFEAPKAVASATAGGQMTPDRSAEMAAALTKANTSTDLAGENKNLTIAGGSANAANSSAVDTGDKKKRSPTGLASSLGINV